MCHMIACKIKYLKGKVKMEQSKNKRANNMLAFVIALSVVAIVVITMFTMASKREEVPVESSSDSQITSKIKQTILDGNNSEKNTEKNSIANNESSQSESKKETKSSETAKQEEKKNEAVKPTVSEEKESFDLPVVGTVTKEYSIDTPVFSITMNDYRAHTGIDISCEEGSGVSACAAGVVKHIVNDPMMGTGVTIEHADGVCSSYMNLNETLPEDIIVGAQVEKGQLIGAVGNSAIVEIASEPHLHFEMTLSGAYVDPLSMLEEKSISVMSENIID
ncbi:MAG: M23 family metallopeptidase [Ruminococcaceae bacterium]|nr:M23 family metallopeptidase [Oscillospiraceae bacterium]